jgi:hypothetical protein
MRRHSATVVTAVHRIRYGRHAPEPPRGGRVAPYYGGAGDNMGAMIGFACRNRAGEPWESR